MPIYEYQCTACGTRLEALQKISDPPLTECGSCGGKLQRLPSAPAFQFRGSGWYVTDYARKGDSGGTAASEGESAVDRTESTAGTEKSSEGATKEAGATAAPSA